MLKKPVLKEPLDTLPTTGESVSPMQIFQLRGFLSSQSWEANTMEFGKTVPGSSVHWGHLVKGECTHCYLVLSKLH